MIHGLGDADIGYHSLNWKCRIQGMSRLNLLFHHLSFLSIPPKGLWYTQHNLLIVVCRFGYSFASVSICQVSQNRVSGPTAICFENLQVAAMLTLLYEMLNAYGRR